MQTNKTTATMKQTSYDCIDCGWQSLTKPGKSCPDCGKDRISENYYVIGATATPIEGSGETVKKSPEWIAGMTFLETCNVTDEDERFLRFYDFIAGWSKSKKHTEGHLTTERTRIIAILEERISQWHEIKNTEETMTKNKMPFKDTLIRINELNHIIRLFKAK